MDKELQNIIGKKNSFSVPNNYFEDLSSRLKSEANLLDLAGMKNEFNIPENYFGHLKQQIENQINLPEVQENIFNTPAGYFENNKLTILAKVNPPKVKLRKVLSLAFIRYAAAACILLTTSLGIYLNTLEISSNAQALSKIPTEDLELYLQQNIESGEVQTLLENIPSETVFSIQKTEFEQNDISEYLNL
jgi:hypothetical protein